MILSYTENEDYEPGPYHANFPKGKNSSEFCINILPDKKFETNETIILTINETTLQPNIVLIDPREVTVTIIDDECKHLIMYFVYQIINDINVLMCKTLKC